MTTGKRYGKNVKTKILDKALRIWVRNPNEFTIKNVAIALGMNHSNIYHHFPNGLFEAVAEHALKKKNVKAVSRLIALGHPAADKLAPSERAEYLTKLAES